MHVHPYNPSMLISYIVQQYEHIFFLYHRLCRTPRILVCRPLVQKRQSVGRASRAGPNLSAGQPADALEGTLSYNLASTLFNILMIFRVLFPSTFQYPKPAVFDV